MDAEATTDQTVGLIKGESGLFRPNPFLSDQEAYPIKFTANSRTAEIEVEVYGHVAMTKNVTITLEGDSASGFTASGTTSFQVEIRPYPTVHFAGAAPIRKKSDAGATQQQQGATATTPSFRVTDRAILKIQLDDVPPQAGAGVNITATPPIFNAKAKKADPNDPDRMYSAEFKDVDQLAQVEVELCQPGTRQPAAGQSGTRPPGTQLPATATISLVLAAGSHCQLAPAPASTSITIKMEDGALNFEDNWINPPGPYAAGDQVWIRVTRQINEPKPKPTTPFPSAGIKGKLIGPAVSVPYEPDPNQQGSNVSNPPPNPPPPAQQPVPYAIEFKETEALSEPVAFTFDHPARAGNDSGFRLLTASKPASPEDKTLQPLQISVEGVQPATPPPTGGGGGAPQPPVEQYGPGGRGRQEVMVHPRRILHFDPDFLNEEHNYAFGDTVKLMVRLSVPARANTKFKIVSQAFKPSDPDKQDAICKAEYVADFPVGSSICAVSVPLDAEPPPLTKETFDCDIQLEPVAGNIQAPKDTEDTETDQLAISLKFPRIGFDADEPVKPPVNKEEGVDAVCGEGTKLTLKVSLSSAALPGTKAKIVAYAFANEAYDVEFEKGDTSKEVEVEMKRGDNDKPMTIILIAEAMCLADENEDGTDGHSRIKVLVKRVPQISFKLPPPETV